MKNKIVSVSLLTASFFACTAHAAIISWGAATNIAGDSDVSTAGSLVQASNFGGFNVVPSSTTINGVTFAPFNISPVFLASYTVGNFTVSSPAGVTASSTAGASGSAPYANLTPAYKLLLTDLAAGNSAPFDLTITGLVVGATYEFQWWSNESQGGSSNGTTTTATAGGAVVLDRNTTGGNVAGGLGQYAIGTFTADSATQLITFSSDSLPIVNGAQLRQISQSTSVPDHGATLAMLGLALAGLAGVRRRFRS